MTQVQDVLLAEPRGFCAGVDRAIEIVERALSSLAPHLCATKLCTTPTWSTTSRPRAPSSSKIWPEVPAGATLIFSAHGVSQAVRQEADARGFQVFDATCPLVTKVHIEVAAAPRGLRVPHDRPQGAPRGGGHHGQLSKASTWSKTSTMSPRYRSATRTSWPWSPRPRCRSTTLRHSGGHQGALPQHPRAQATRHLLRHPEPPGRHQDHGAPGGRGHRGGQPDQFQQQIACVNGRAPQDSRLHG